MSDTRRDVTDSTNEIDRLFFYVDDTNVVEFASRLETCQASADFDINGLSTRLTLASPGVPAKLGVIGAGDRGRCLVEVAAGRGQPFCLSYLLCQQRVTIGADCKPLLYAVERGHVRCVRLLIRYCTNQFDTLQSATLAAFRLPQSSNEIRCEILRLLLPEYAKFSDEDGEVGGNKLPTVAHLDGNDWATMHKDMDYTTIVEFVDCAQFAQIQSLFVLCCVNDKAAVLRRLLRNFEKEERQFYWLHTSGADDDKMYTELDVYRKYKEFNEDQDEESMLALAVRKGFVDVVDVLLDYRKCDSSPGEADDVLDALRRSMRANQKASADSVSDNDVVAAKRAKSQESLCVICKTAAVSLAIRPCGHLCLCKECKLPTGTKKCPVCRCVMRGAPLRVYT